MTGIKRGLYLAPFDRLADPRLLAELAGRAESRDWDGLFLWDRIAYPPQGRAVADPWVALSAIAMATDLVVEAPPGADIRQWESAGATWVLTSFEPQPPANVVREVIEAGP